MASICSSGLSPSLGGPRAASEAWVWASVGLCREASAVSTSALQTLPLEALCWGVTSSEVMHRAVLSGEVWPQSCTWQEPVLPCIIFICPFPPVPPSVQLRVLLLFFLLQNPNGTYTGFIKVQMELCKPPQASPSGCMNTLHISSTNTVGEVIEALLKKFLVTESPAKFALYKRCYREDQGTWPAQGGRGLRFNFVSCAHWQEGWWACPSVRGSQDSSGGRGRCVLAVRRFELGSVHLESSGITCDEHLCTARWLWFSLETSV